MDKYTDKYISDYVMELKSCQVKLEQTLDKLSKGNSREDLDELLSEVNHLKMRLNNLSLGQYVMETRMKGGIPPIA